MNMSQFLHQRCDSQAPPRAHRSHPSRRSRARWAAWLATLALAAPAAGERAAPAAETRCAETESAAALELATLLGSIHVELALQGAAPDDRPDPGFLPGESLPSLRELVLHARELVRKADRLARARQPSPQLDLPPPQAEPGIEDLRALLESCLRRLEAARRTESSVTPIEVEANTPAQVLAAIRSADRALGELLVESPTTGEVHWVVTRALAFSSSLRARWPGRRMPLAPPEEELVTDDDVYRALVRCWNRVQALMGSAGPRRLEHQPPAEEIQVRRGRLHALASILCDELELLHQLHGDPAQLPPTCPRREVRTSELLQRLELLGRQLRELRELATSPQLLAQERKP